MFSFSSTLKTKRSAASFVPPRYSARRYKSPPMYSSAYIIRQQPNALPLMQPVALTRRIHCAVFYIYILRIRPALFGSFTTTKTTSIHGSNFPNMLATYVMLSLNYGTNMTSTELVRSPLIETYSIYHSSYVYELFNENLIKVYRILYNDYKKYLHIFLFINEAFFISNKL